MTFNDEFSGVGGEYLIDKKTGKRVPIVRVSVPDEASAPVVAEVEQEIKTEAPSAHQE